MDINEAIVLYLKHYPSSNKEEFRSVFKDESHEAAVRAILDETMQTNIEWGHKTLIELGDEVQSIMHERHPELSTEALRRLGNYFTYLVK